MESKWRDDDDCDEKDKKSSKSDGFSSPRKRLAQAKLQANAIDDEVRLTHYCLTSSIIEHQSCSLQIDSVTI
jgi:hypothetical protein